MNRSTEQRTRRIAARIAAIAAVALMPLAGAAGTAVADPAANAPISDFTNNSDFGWDDRGQYGYRDHHRQDYDGWNDHLNSGHREDYRSPSTHNNRGSDYDAPVNWESDNPRGGAQSPAVPNPYIPPAPAAPLPMPQVQLPHLPLPLTGLPPLPGTGSAG